MTCIVKDFKTKKALKEHVQAGHDFTVEDPSLFNPYYGDAKTLLRRKGSSIVVTNHPKRSWFAKVELVNETMKVS